MGRGVSEDHPTGQQVDDLAERFGMFGRHPLEGLDPVSRQPGVAETVGHLGMAEHQPRPVGFAPLHRTALEYLARETVGVLIDLGVSEVERARGVHRPPSLVTREPTNPVQLASPERLP